MLLKEPGWARFSCLRMVQAPESFRLLGDLLALGDSARLTPAVIEYRKKLRIADPALFAHYLARME